MTGALSSMSNIHGFSGFNFYFSENIPQKVLIKKIEFEYLTDYERRILTYPYLPKEKKEPYAVAFFEKFNVIKIFVPKKCIKIVPLDIEEKEYEDVEGLFLDSSSPTTMLEYNNDKYVTLIESSLGTNDSNFFITLHETNYLDIHREDFEIIPNYIQPMSLVNKYLVYLATRTKTGDSFGEIFFSSDESLWFIGTKINEIYEDVSLSKYPTGAKGMSMLLNSDFSLNFIGDTISYSDNTILITEEDKMYRRWAYDDDTQNLPEEHITWNRFKYAPDNIK